MKNSLPYENIQIDPLLHLRQLDLEDAKKQITRVIIVDEKTVGVVWIELFDNHGVPPPSVHIMIGNPNYRGMGVGRAALTSAIVYARAVIRSKILYTRYLASNVPVAALNKSLGFQKDGDTYRDEDGLEWQNASKVLNSGDELA